MVWAPVEAAAGIGRASACPENDFFYPVGHGIDEALGQLFRIFLHPSRPVRRGVDALHGVGEHI